jgi:hypothetical protein
MLETAPNLTREAIEGDTNRWIPGALAARDRALKKIRDDLLQPNFTSPMHQAEWERDH